MYCIHCGKKIADDSKTCSFCGGEQPGNNKVDETIKKYTEYLTPNNLELVGSLSLLLPIFMCVVTFVLGLICNILGGIPIIGFLFRLIYVLVKILFVVAALAGTVALGYLAFTNEQKRTIWTYIALGAAVLSFAACLSIAFHWPIVPIICGIISVIFGIDCASRVFLQKKGIETQPEVCKDLGEYKVWYDNYKKEHPTIKPDLTKDSYFDGNGLTLLGMYIVSAILCTITLGLATPWRLCKIKRWEKEHTVIDGKRLKFTGKGGSLLGHWILWEFLTIITVGIYAFFVHVALKKWEMKHTFYEDGSEIEGKFDGNSFQYFGYGLLCGLLLLITCCLAAPWTITILQKWETKHSLIASDRLKYEGTALGILGQYIIVFLLTIITLGIYSPWGTVRLNKYIYSHTHVDK